MPAGEIARVFFAIWPLGGAADAIAAHAARRGIDGRLVAAPRLHLTLAFYGRCGGNDIEILMQRAAAIEASAFELLIDRLGYFRRGGVVWAAPAHASPALSSLAEQLAPIADRGVDRKRFCPHITLARDARPPASKIFPAVALAVDSFALVASGEHGSPGAYRALARWSLC